MPLAPFLSDLSAALDRALPVALSVQLKGLIEYGIACGELPAGTRLPSVRELAEAGGIAPMTAVAVYKELRTSGLIVARQGAGTYVADRPHRGRAESLMRIQSLLESTLVEAELINVSPTEVASLLNACISRSRIREHRPLRLVMIGVFEDATQAYARDIQKQLKAGDTISAVTLDHLRHKGGGPASALPQADLYVTLANRRAEVETLLGPSSVLTSISFIPSEKTRARLGSVDPQARLGLVSVFPEFLALMKPAVLRFAPHVRSVTAIVIDDPDFESFLESVDVVVYATGAEAKLSKVGIGMPTIEYRHIPDPHSVEATLLPLIETIRSGARTPASREPATTSPSAMKETAA